MVKDMKYVIMAYSNDKTFDIPRQLVKINGEPLVKRTIRLLKENSVKNIVVMAKDKRFDNLGVERYDPLHNDFDYIKRTGYWLNAFSEELLVEPICFIWGDVYFSENAIKKIVETNTDSLLFFCTLHNNHPYYIKKHDEPLAYKVVDYKLFKKHINIVKKAKDKGLCCREPIVWELYRSLEGLDINKHEMKDNYIAINDISCDIDSKKDAEMLEKILGGEKMVKCEVINQNVQISEINRIKNIKRIKSNEEIEQPNLLEVGDTFETDEEFASYLAGETPKLQTVCIKVLEIVPDKKEESKEERTAKVVYVNDSKLKTRKTPLTKKPKKVK